MTPTPEHTASPSAQDERAAFERWFSDEGKSPLAIKRDDSGAYRLMSAHTAWGAWQAAWAARAALATPPTATPTDTAAGGERDALSALPACLCIYPACGADCCGCNRALTPADVRLYALRYAYLRERPLDTIPRGGVFAGMTPQNIVLNGDDLDEAVDAALSGVAP